MKTVPKSCAFCCAGLGRGGKTLRASGVAGVASRVGRAACFSSCSHLSRQLKLHIPHALMHSGVLYADRGVSPALAERYTDIDVSRVLSYNIAGGWRVEGGDARPRPTPHTGETPTHTHRRHPGQGDTHRLVGLVVRPSWLCAAVLRGIGGTGCVSDALVVLCGCGI